MKKNADFGGFIGKEGVIFFNENLQRPYRHVFEWIGILRIGPEAIWKNDIFSCGPPSNNTISLDPNVGIVVTFSQAQALKTNHLFKSPRDSTQEIFRHTMCVQRPARFIGIHRHFQITGRIRFSFQDEQCCNHLSIAPVSHHISLPPKFTVLTQVSAG